jgi:hypothetical protein
MKQYLRKLKHRARGTLGTDGLTSKEAPIETLPLLHDNRLPLGSDSKTQALGYWIYAAWNDTAWINPLIYIRALDNGRSVADVFGVITAKR